MGLTKIIIIIGVIIVFIFGFSYFYQQDWELQREENSFYEEWCPKLNSTFKEPEDYFGYHSSCLREENGIITLYYITSVGGEYKLKERRK